MNENIGVVCVNYDYYQGEDLYSDGDVEDELLEIVKEVPKEEYNKVIFERKSWPILYHLSDVRQNIINWFPFEKDAEVLEVGAGCGAITGAIAKSAGKVTALDLSKRRSLINAYRNKDKSNIEIYVGNFNDVAENLNKEFDYITLIGVLEYAKAYIPEKDADKVFLKKIWKLLRNRGKVIIAIENQLGLKYFAGCKEDHLGQYFVGLEGYSDSDGVRTYSKKKLQELLEECGFGKLQFYYPYPDYKLPDRIYSDQCLPQKGELVNNLRNFDTDRMVLFDETKAFDTIIEAGLFSQFSNSFLIVAEKEV